MPPANPGFIAIANDGGWAYVDIDGKRQKKPSPFPPPGIQVPAGKHVVVLHHPVNASLDQTYQIEVRSGETKVVVVRFPPAK